MPKSLKLLRSRIKALMSKAGWNQADLARHLDWEPGHLSHYLKDREPGFEKIDELCAVFGVSPAELFADETVQIEPRVVEHKLKDCARKIFEAHQGHKEPSAGYIKNRYREKDTDTDT